MKQMHASVCIELPTDEFDEAAAKLKVKPIWEAFLKALLDCDIAAETKLETVETRAKPATTGRRGRPRKTTPTLVSPANVLVSQPPGGDAA